jgi:hypothetical protein
MLIHSPDMTFNTNSVIADSQMSRIIYRHYRNYIVMAANIAATGSGTVRFMTICTGKVDMRLVT